MLGITIDRQQYFIPVSWDEITLDEVCKLHTIALAFPEKLQKYYESFIKKEGDTEADVKQRSDNLAQEFTAEEMMKEFPKHFGKVIGLLGGIPDKVMELVMPADRTILYQQYLFRFVFGILFNATDHEITGLEKFKFDGEEYYLPASREILGQTQPMSDETALTFTEAADLLTSANEMKEGKWERAANIVAILCRKKGEEYDEKVSLERAKEFMQLPMSVIFEVFFCVMIPLLTSKQREVISLLESENEQKKELVN